jgi:hypothetical protein
MTEIQPIARFRIASLEGPFDTGTLNQFHDYILEVELDPGGVYHTQRGKVGVRFFDTAHWALGADDQAVIPFEQQARARVAHYVIRALQRQLPTGPSIFPLRLQPTVEEARALASVDPRKVDINAWTPVEPQPSPSTGVVFVSCGQSSDAEIGLGQSIATLVSERTGLEAYFAQNQQSLEGVTREIFNKIHNASAFIAVMHRRDQLSAMPDTFRGSVWVEQEIAIAAFITQSLGLKLPSRAYVQRGIRREGVRGYILLNPIEFDDEQDVLRDLETFWQELRPR